MVLHYFTPSPRLPSLNGYDSVPSAIRLPSSDFPVLTEGSRNFLVDKGVSAPTIKAPAAVAALSSIEEATEQKEERENNNNISVPKTAGDITLV